MGSQSTDKPIHFLRFLRWKHLLESFAQELLGGPFGELQNILVASLGSSSGKFALMALHTSCGFASLHLRTAMLADIHAGAENFQACPSQNATCRPSKHAKNSTLSHATATCIHAAQKMLIWKTCCTKLVQKIKNIPNE